jgi:UDP-N-acetylmuramate dehydrogenase
MQLTKQQPLGPLTTFGIGGPARLFAVASSVEDVIEAQQLGERLFVLGRGSNCLFDDAGFDGLVLHNRLHFIRSEGSVVEVGAGYPFSHLGVATARRGLSGLEFASGIPGSVGGAVVMNAGANGQETVESLLWVEVVTPSGEVRRYERSELEYGYRHSPFQGNGEIVVAAAFELTQSETARAHQLQLLAARKSSQPLSDQSAGCIFRNPAGGSAGELIERCGLKGKRLGGVEVSPIHANFMVNRGGATAAEARELIAQVQAEVRRQTGVELMPEVLQVSSPLANRGATR